MSNSINTAIASFGMSGKVFHAPFIHAHPGFNLYGIVERHRNDSRQQYGYSRLFRSFDELLADDHIDLVVINTPVQTHFEYAQKAIAAGKNIIVEKPFTVTAAEAAALDHMAAAHHIKATVYQNRRYDGDYTAVKQVLAQKILGDIKEVEIRFDRYRTTLSDKAHKEDNIPGAGTLHDLGAHLIDQALQLFGKPVSVFADLAVMRPQSLVNDYFELILIYPDGKRVRLKSTTFAKNKSYEYVLHGSKGSFLQQRSDEQELHLVAGAQPALAQWIEDYSQPDGLLDYLSPDGAVKQSTTSKPGNYMQFYTDVYEYIVNNAPNPVPFSDAVATMQLIDAALKSKETRQIVPF